jgi:endonuclease-3
LHRNRSVAAPLVGRGCRRREAPRAKSQGQDDGPGRDRSGAPGPEESRRGRRNRALARATRSKRREGRVNAQKRHEIFSRLRAQNPDPRSELVYGTPFELLVAVVLSAQATDKSVNLATAKLYPVANTPRKIVALGEAKLTEYIRTIGLFRTKAKNVIALSRLLLERHGGEVPASREALEALPGVGRKTANVVLNVAFGQPTIAVDTHIFRVANRTGIAPGKDPLEVEEKLLKFTPEEFKQHAHHWLILHGRYVCVARKPGCPECVIRDLCEYRPKTRA